VNRSIDPNRVILSLVARGLGDLRESLVFVGGCATGKITPSCEIGITADFYWHCIRIFQEQAGGLTMWALTEKS
jgi:hypothetical protein